jgi:hypothetical protein
MFFNDLRQHGKIAAKRHPMYEKNKLGKFLMYFTAVSCAVCFIFTGIGLAYGFKEIFPGMEPFHVLNKVLL